MGYAIKDWKKFQHFKDRTPPWVKLYRDILDDPDWHSLSPEAAKTLVMLWVIASEDETKQGLLPESKKLAFRLRISEKSLESIMSQLFHWLIQVDNGAISERYQLDAPERAPEETEGETEGETKTEKSLVETPGKKIPPCPQKEILALFGEHLPMLTQPRLWDGARAELLKTRWRYLSKPNGATRGYQTEADGLAFFARFFAYVAKSKTLTEGIPRKPGDGDGVWQPDLPWLLKASNFAKVIEGKYHGELDT